MPETLSEYKYFFLELTDTDNENLMYPNIFSTLKEEYLECHDKIQHTPHA